MKKTYEGVIADFLSLCDTDVIRTSTTEGYDPFGIDGFEDI